MLGTCAHCNVEKNLVARGLCNNCYHWIRKRADLTEFDTKNQFGSIRSRILARVDFDGPIMPGMLTECWLWTGAKNVKNGYGVIRLGGRKGKNHVVTRLLLEMATKKPLPETVFACHHCDNRACVRPSHLFPGTAAVNNADMERKGRARKAVGEKCGRSKLVVAQVLEIREMYRAAIPGPKIAERFQISIATVYAITSRKTWKHLP